MTIKRSTLVLVGVVALATLLATWTFHASIAKSLIAAVAFLVVFRAGLAMITGLAQPVPEPPEPGTLRKVKLTYRCSICGAEVRMTSAPAEEPEPPRHCLEDMELVAPVME